MTARRASAARAFIVRGLVAGLLAGLGNGAAAPPVRAQQPAPAPTPPATQNPVFRAGANLVLVDAYPQRQGKIVEGLTPADFQVFEDGKAQAIDSFEFVRVEPATEEARRDPNTVAEMKALAANPHNRVFITFLNTLYTTLDGGNRIRRPLVDTLDRIIGPDDLFGVMTQDMRPSDIALGRKMETVDEQLSKYWFWGQRDRSNIDTDDPLEVALESCGLGSQLTTLIDRHREDKTLTSLENLVKYVATIREARTVVIVITDGWLLYGPDNALAQNGVPGGNGAAIPMVPLRPTGGILPPSQSMDTTTCNTEVARLASLDDARRFRDLMAAANRADVSFYPVSAGGLAVFDSSIATATGSLASSTSAVVTRVSGLQNLAENTDGIAVTNTNDLAAGVRRIADDVSAYYLLGYYSTNNAQDGKYRTIQVKMRPAGLTVHARRGYLAPSAVERTATSAAPAASVPSAEVTKALEGLAKVQQSVDLYTRATMAPGDLTVVAELASHLIGATDWAAGGTVTVTVTGANGVHVATGTGTFDPNGRSATVHVPLAGVVHGALNVSTVLQVGRSLADDRIDAAADTGALLGPAAVYRATPSLRSALLPVADVEFRRTERLHVEWPVLKALDQRTARLLDLHGKPLAVAADVTERDVAGQSTVAVDVNLAPLAEGDYLVELNAGSGSDTERKLIAFRLVR